MNELSKYQKAFNSFQEIAPIEKISLEVAEIIGEKFNTYNSPEVWKQLHGFIDLTSLTTLDTKESIWKLVARVNDFEGERPDVPNVAAICTYPLFVETVKQALTAEEVKIASVAAGFPASQTFTEIKIAETAMAVMEGADEIDVVLNLGLFMEGNFDELTEELQEIKASCRDAKLKVILETGALQTTEQIQQAAILALYSGADFLKTSTGKEYPGASLSAAYVLCHVLKQYEAQTNRRIGLKVAGGIRTVDDAVRYYTLVKEILGDAWLTKDYFRIGASSLQQALLTAIGE
ncbi:deoxyribose-phosphate aldolase [Parabacteroides sp. OttesenSCG-928-N08]|nr:deoxyribose-phosphate aldolase [Parabacteroides sp. OttesenSCG-928-N08]